MQSRFLENIIIECTYEDSSPCVYDSIVLSISSLILSKDRKIIQTAHNIASCTKMGLLTLLRSFTRGSTEDKDARILLLGLDNSGKTTILKKLADEDTTSVVPTQGFCVKSLKHGLLKFNVWDIGGQKSIRLYWRNYYDNTSTIIYVIDSADRRRMEETGLELQQLLDEEKLLHTPLLILANKQDLINALSIAEIQSGLNLHSIRGRKWKIVSCSAKSGEGLEEALQFIESEIHSRKTI